MTERDQFIVAFVYLLKQEVEALRSVLSEWENDKDCYVMWRRAEDLRAIIESLEYKL